MNPRAALAAGGLLLAAGIGIAVYSISKSSTYEERLGMGAVWTKSLTLGAARMALVHALEVEDFEIRRRRSRKDRILAVHEDGAMVTARFRELGRKRTEIRIALHMTVDREIEDALDEGGGFEILEARLESIRGALEEGTK